MNLSKSNLKVAGGLSLAALALTLAAPRAVHALAATLVQVTNTSTNPVITLPEHKAASQLVQLSSQYSIGPSGIPTTLSAYNTATSNTGTTPYVVPAGQSLVITDLDFDLFGVTANTDVGVLVSNGNNNPTVFGQYYERYDFANIPFTTTEHISQQSGLVFPAGSTVALAVVGKVDSMTPTLRGYLTSQ